MYTKKNTTIIITTLISLFANQALALDINQLKIGFGVGAKSQKLKPGPCDNLISSTFSSSSCTSKNDGNSYKLIVNYELTPRVAIEGSYVNLEKTEISQTILDQGKSKNTNGNIKTSGITLEAMAIYPLNDYLNIFGKLGFIVANTTTSSALTDTDRNISTSSATPAFGIGGKTNFGKNIDVRLEWERFRNIADKQKLQEGYIDLASISVLYSFK